MKKTIVWYGNMTHGEFELCNDRSSIVIIDSIDEKRIMYAGDSEEYRITKGYDSYLIPDEYDGLIAFSKSFIKGLIA